jgi:hypothetical protein
MTLSMHALAIGVPSRAFASQPPAGSTSSGPSDVSLIAGRER